MNCARVAAYRIQCRTGLYRVAAPVRDLEVVGSALMAAGRRPQACSPDAARALIAEADRIVGGCVELYERHRVRVGTPPSWQRDPLLDKEWRGSRRHWSEVSEFATLGLDIKNVWEMSRFRWAVILTKAYALTGQRVYLKTFGAWLDSWIRSNPENAGVNWKCAQETSIRMLRLLEALAVLDWSAPAQAAIDAFISAHVRRIRATMMYAVAQDNNHGTSEAAALFVGAQWLARHALTNSRAMARISESARRRLNERVERLVAPDGSFSQHSTNYHRMLLDTISLVEVWRRRLEVGTPFEARALERIRAAIDWLACMVDSSTGEAPNLGANDGTILLISPSTDYQDHRPSLQLASCLILKQRLFESGPWDDASRLLGIEPDEYPVVRKTRRSRLFADGGYAVLTGDDDSWCLLRLPKYRFRPSHSDALHLDLWIGSLNVVRDTGTYSYNADGGLMEYFSGTRGHSTCEFDGHDQMRRAGRFLFSRWLTPETLSFLEGEGGIGGRAEASYRDYTGARHKRSVTYSGGAWIIDDELSGYRQRAVARWHLAPCGWVLSGRRLASEAAGIEIEVAGGVGVSLRAGFESRHYLERTSIPVLEVSAAVPSAVLRTTVRILR